MKRISAVLLLSLLASSLFAAFNDIYDDGLILEAEIIEVKEKPSMPIGEVARFIQPLSS